MTIARLTALAATGAAATALTACSSSGSSTSANTSPPAQQSTASTSAQPAGGKSATATETEFDIALSTTKLPAGTWTLHVKNAGKIRHALTVDGPGVKDKSTGDIAPGSSATLTFTLEPGSYEIYCPVGDHKMEGMEQKVQVS